MIRKALYQDGQFVRYLIERPKPSKPAVVEVLDVVEDDAPTPDSSQKVVTDIVVENGRHRIRKQLAAKSQEELDSDASGASESAEADRIRQAYQLFKSGGATNKQAQDAIAWLIRQVAGGAQ